MNNDDDLRQLFQDATADIRPHGTLDDIRAQTKKVDPMARRWFLPSLAAAAAMALVIGGAFWATRDSDADKGSSNVAAPPSQTPSNEPTAPSTTDAQIFFVGEGARGPRLYAEEHQASLDDYQTDAANLSATGTPTDPDYRTYWPKSARIEGVAMVSDGTEHLQIQLAEAVPDRPAGVTAAQAARQVQAIVRTVQAGHASFYDQGTPLPPIEFYADGKLQDKVLGVTGPEFTPGNDDEVLALVSISNLADGATVKAGKLTVEGVANAFEAAYTWEILVGGDAVVDSGFGTAAECCKLSPYSFTSNIALEPGTYTVVVHDNDESGQGRPVNRDTKEIVVE